MKAALLSIAIFTTLAAAEARAGNSAKGVGLGVAGGLAYSPSKVEGERVGSSFAWGFFVDIPLLDTFYISPAAMLYELDVGNGKLPVTDIDLNFKFIVPIGDLHVGAGVTAGVTAGVPNDDGNYAGHFGLLGYLSYNLIANLDIFVLAQWKQLQRSGGKVDDIHGYAGGMFRF
jgi:hypothetical protein